MLLRKSTKVLRNYGLGLRKLRSPAAVMLTAPLHMQSFDVFDEQVKANTNKIIKQWKKKKAFDTNLEAA
jgi:hypothetical protein